MKNYILPLALIAGAAPLAHAATTITFESPYTLGTLSVAPVSLTDDRPFTGQQGWSRSTSSNVGNIITTTTSGSYTGGQGLTGNASDGVDGTYIGAKAIASIDMTTMTSMAFDFRYQSKELGLGGWNDADPLPAGPDGLFDQSEAQFMAGIVATSASTWAFGLRGAGFLGSGGTYLGRFSTGITGTGGSWYRMTVTPNSALNRVTLGVFNLTTNTAVALTTSVFNLTAAQFGVATAGYEGIAARVTSNNTAQATIDNIQIIPEPSAALLGGLGILGLLRRRR